MSMMNSRGQAAVEVLFAAPIIAIVFGVGFYLMYLTFAQAWLTRSAREAAACLVTNVPQSRCREKLQSTLTIGILFGRAEIDTFRSGADGSHVRVSFAARTRFLDDDILPRRLIGESSFPGVL